MITYEDFNVGDIISISKGTAVWSIKLQKIIILYEDIKAKITHTTYGKDIFFLMPQNTVRPLMYVDFSYDKSKLTATPIPPTTEYIDDTTFGELEIIFNEEEWINTDRKMKLDKILNEN